MQNQIQLTLKQEAPVQDGIYNVDQVIVELRIISSHNPNMERLMDD